jgi:hypothetical protein
MSDSNRDSGRTVVAWPVRRSYWDADRWLEYGLRIHQAMERIIHVLHRLPPTPGWRARDTHVFCKIGNYLQLSLLTMERIILLHFGGLREDMPEPLQQPPQHWVKHPHIEARPWTRRLERISREDWQHFGNMVNEARSLIATSYIVFRNECYGNDLDHAHHLSTLRKAEQWIDKAKGRLNDLVCKQHPDWGDAAKVFSG